ncbi:reverse transcriptase (RNA-dependent DNA polymerase) domain-containing protein [Hirsutella rhossiliensis]|uniref:Reverse transcriptase (RNA-dependent DNA polymerase) domain-containing protein n=1 Tax=Hirsutella rhossiliensis TaxID=111463 RepID=A0A9P8SDC3_9HYPO|nr:reverse transcriptase (RNA-dependent DNA polymerase) domain-containing protein [Hirsutella rhossiliensis]KAH0958456.1 reverse transcriptase (RNA-dependent DNA polymerase) domain-containing protein [Hirsutella rhossiliensis]
MAMAARFDLELIQYDAVNAFVNASLDEEVFMKMPPGHRKHGTVLKLNKALYGLRKSPLLWHRELTNTLKKLGFKPVPHEPCCLTLNGIIVFFYVDDIVFAYQRKNESRAQALEAQMREKYQLTGGNSLQWFLGIEILRDREKGFIWLSQASYIDKISRLAKKHRSFDTPMGVNELFPFNGIASFADINSYQVKIGSVLYAAVITRPDIAFVTSKLSKFNPNPGPKHHEAADRVICYLQQTKGLALRLGGGDDFEVASDASFADNSSDRKSSQAFAMKLFGGLIGWRANKQDTVTTSTTEAELLALSQAAKESIYVSRLIRELDVKLDHSRISIQCDNTQTIRIVTAEVATLRTKLRHVDIHNHWLRQEITNGTLEVKYTPSAEMMADGLTKALQGPKFQAFVNQIGLHDISDRLASRELPESTDSILQEQSYKMWEDQVV